MVDWKLALPLHPEFRTLPMVWYVPPTSPLVSGGVEDAKGLDQMCIRDSSRTMLLIRQSFLLPE